MKQINIKKYILNSFQGAWQLITFAFAALIRRISSFRATWQMWMGLDAKLAVINAAAMVRASAWTHTGICAGHDSRCYNQKLRIYLFKLFIMGKWSLYRNDISRSSKIKNLCIQAFYYEELKPLSKWYIKITENTTM